MFFISPIWASWLIFWLGVVQRITGPWRSGGKIRIDPGMYINIGKSIQRFWCRFAKKLWMGKSSEQVLVPLIVPHHQICHRVDLSQRTVVEAWLVLLARLSVKKPPISPRTSQSINWTLERLTHVPWCLYKISAWGKMDTCTMEHKEKNGTPMSTRK
jgi:hypothetical protein